MFVSFYIRGSFIGRHVNCLNHNPALRVSCYYYKYIFLCEIWSLKSYSSVVHTGGTTKILELSKKNFTLWSLIFRQQVCHPILLQKYMCEYYYIRAPSFCIRDLHSKNNVIIWQVSMCNHANNFI